MPPLVGPGRAVVLLAGVLALGAAAGPTPSRAAPAYVAHAAGNSASFTDPSGDSVSGGPDITGISISNDDSGIIHMQVLIPNTGTQANGGGVGIYIDVNGDGTEDYTLLVKAGQGTAGIYQSSTGDPVSDPNLRSSYNAGLTVDFSRSVIGANSVTQIQFVVETLFNDTHYYYDRAPDSGWFHYTLGAVPPSKPSNPSTPSGAVKIPLTTILSRPDHPQAGQRFVVSFKATQSGKTMPSAGATCKATAGGRPVAAHAAYAKGSGTCSLIVPHGSGGKALVVTITASAAGGASDTVVSRDTIVGEATLKIGPAVATPPTPTAGGDFYLSIAVFVLRQGAPKSRLQGGSVQCLATVDGRKLKQKRALVMTGAGVQCGWSIPPSARGRAMRALVVVRSFGQATQKSYLLLVH